MESLPIALVLLSAALHAIWNIWAKQSGNKLIFLWLAMASARLLYLPLFAYELVGHGLEGANWIAFAFAGLFHTLYILYLGRTYEEGDISYTYPIVRSYPLLAAIPAFILWGEELTTLAVAGILIMLGGLFSINLEGNGGGIPALPKKLNNKALIFAAITALTSVGYSISDKMGAASMSPVIFFYLLGLPMLVILTPYTIGKCGMEAIDSEFRANKWRIAGAGILMFGSYLIILYVFSMSKLVYVLSLRQVSIVFGVILGTRLLGEKYGRIRLMASLLIFFGAYLIASAK